MAKPDSFIIAVQTERDFSHENDLQSCRISKLRQIADQNHFDNPVYSLQRSEDNSSLLNNVQIRNNLGQSSKASNLEKQKLGYNLDDDEDSYKGVYGAVAKNRDADLGNPNVYQCIDEYKDHLYDEIKGKEGAEQEYDHLDYTRPGTSINPHYHRMANGMVIKKPETNPPE